MEGRERKVYVKPTLISEELFRNAMMRCYCQNNDPNFGWYCGTCCKDPPFN